MAIVVEDGTLVAGANSFVTVSEAAAYWTARNDEDFADADNEVKEAALLAAAAYLRDEQMFPYRGTRVAYDQTMPWPRTGASVYRGPAIPITAIPWQVKEAQMALAYHALAGFTALQPNQERGGRIQTETIDVLTTTYFEDAPSGTTYPMAQGLLSTILRTKEHDPFPYQAAQAEVLTPFERGEFENNS